MSYIIEHHLSGVYIVSIITSFSCNHSHRLLINQKKDNKERSYTLREYLNYMITWLHALLW
jgi:hypothetical protein